MMSEPGTTPSTPVSSRPITPILTRAETHGAEKITELEEKFEKLAKEVKQLVIQTENPIDFHKLPSDEASKTACDRIRIINREIYANTKIVIKGGCKIEEAPVKRPISKIDGNTLSSL